MPNIISMMGQQYIFLFQFNKTNQTKNSVFDNLANKYKQPLSAQCKVPKLHALPQVK